MYPSFCRSLLLATRQTYPRRWGSVAKKLPVIAYTMNHSSFRGFHGPPPSQQGIVTFKLADIGEGITEVELLNWTVKQGEHIEEMGDVCVVQSDKSAVEISSPLTGSIVKLYHQVGDVIKIGSPLMDIDVGGETEPEESTIQTETTQVEDTTALSSQKNTPKDAHSAASNKAEEAPASLGLVSKTKELRASPSVRALAREHNVDLHDVVATTHADMITKEDIFNYIKTKASGKSTDTEVAEHGIKEEIKKKVQEELPKHTSGQNGTQEIVLTSPIAKGMVKSMNQSLTVPYMSLQEDIDITDLLVARNKLNAFLKSVNCEDKITVTTLIIKAVSKALTLVPMLNSKFDAVKMDRYTQYAHHNVSVAIDTPRGLVVPNIKNVENFSLREIQTHLTELIDLAKNNRLTIHHMTGGTISISNVGVIGATSVRPIVFDGQACILGLGRTQKLPKYNPATKSFDARDILNITASVDHRHIDGATVARFIRILRETLEDIHILSL